MGKPSISMGHLYRGYVTNNQRVISNIQKKNMQNWFDDVKYICPV